MQASATLRDSVWPIGFLACLGYTVWYFPRFIVAAGLANDNLRSSYTAAGPVDYLAFAGMVAFLVVGVAQVRALSGEIPAANLMDRISLFLARVTMLLVALLVAVMFYEVVSRYVFERPTIWANELSLWMAGLVFLIAGLYSMQQRAHISIFLLYDRFPRTVQRVCDTISTVLIVVFALAMLWGGYNEARDKFLRWETFGTAFDPPIPATMKALILFIILLVAVQAVVNLIADWSKAALHHAVVDEDEIADVKHAVEDFEASHPKDRPHV